MNVTSTQKSKFVKLTERGFLKDAGNVESALVLIPLLILFTGIIQLYSLHNAKSSLEQIAEGIAQSSISIHSTAAAQFAAQEYFKKSALPKIAYSESLKVEVIDEQVAGFVIRKVFIRDTKYSNLIGFFPLQVSTTVILNQ